MSDEAEGDRRKEIDNRVRRSTWEICFEEDVPEDAQRYLQIFRYYN